MTQKRKSAAFSAARSKHLLDTLHAAMQECSGWVMHSRGDNIVCLNFIRHADADAVYDALNDIKRGVSNARLEDERRSEANER